MRNIGFIMFIAYVVWQIVYSVSQGAQKKDQQRRARELAEQRRRASAGSAPASTPGQLTTAAGPGASARGTSRLDELAERRKQQLEQLRLRRVKHGGAATQVRAGTPSSPSLPTAAVPAVLVPRAAPRPKSPLEADRKSLQRYQESNEQDREDKRQHQASQAKSQRRKEKVREKESARLLDQERADQRAVRQKAPSVPTVVAATSSPGGPVSRDAIRGRMHDRQLLRELFVLKELLDPPLAMRANSGAGSVNPEDPL